MYEACGGTGRAPTLTTRMLSKWVAAEYEVFQIYAKHMISSYLKFSKNKDDDGRCGAKRLCE